MPTILIRKPAAPGAVPIPLPLPGVGQLAEPFYSPGGFNNTPVHIANSNDVVIHNGTAIVPLISPQRQVELVGAQTITGPKTFSLASFLLTGGAPDNVLITDGAGNLRFGPQTVAGGGIVAVNHDATMTGNGDDIELSVIIATAALRGAVNVPAGTALTLTGSALGMTVAAGAVITAGADDIFPVTSLGLRGQMGADRLALTTAAQTIVPAINELNAAILALSGVMVLVGGYNATTNQVIPGSGGELPAAALPAASPANAGYYLIVTVAGTGTGNAPNVPMTVGSWIVSNGTAWTLVDVSQPPVTASGVGVAPPVNGQGNVQDALESLAQGVLTDVSLTGRGIVGDLLSVALVDGGTY
jgi:hypothetical protein